MKITRNKVFSNIAIAMGVVAVFLMGTNPVSADPESGWWNAPGDDPAREGQFFQPPGWEGGSKTTDSRTGAVHTYQYRTDSNTGDRIEVDRDYTINKNKDMTDFRSLQTTTRKDKSTSQEAFDEKGNPSNEVDKDRNGRVTSTKTYYKDGSGYEQHNNYPGTNKTSSVTMVHSGVTTTTNYGTDGQETSSSSFDANTNTKVSRGYVNGKMTDEIMTLKDGSTLRRGYGANGNLGTVETDDPNTGITTNTIYRADGST